MNQKEIKEKIIEILCGKENDRLGKKCKKLFNGTANQILELFIQEKQKWVEEEYKKGYDNGWSDLFHGQKSGKF